MSAIGSLCVWPLRDDVTVRWIAGTEMGIDGQWNGKYSVACIFEYLIFEGEGIEREGGRRKSI